MTVRAGFIGVGGISDVHLAYLQTRKDVEIVAMADPDSTHLNHHIQKYGGKGYSDYRDLLRKEELDAVWICTPPQIREEPILESVDRGLAVFCEKPVARSLEQAQKIAAELEKRKGARVQIGYVFRAMPIIEALKQAVADDSIRLVQSFYGSPMSRTMELPAWFYEKEKSGGGLVDQATHNLDLFRYVVGEIPYVKGFAANPAHPKEPGYTIDELISLSFEFENGSLGSHLHTWLGDKWRNEMVFIGEKRMYRIDIWAGELVIEEEWESRSVRQDMDKMYHHENERFLEMVQANDPARNICPFEEGLRTLELVLRCDAALS
ncbi:MAG: Gfo/Idh/MocA family oxidoreductase [Calditrichaeota bacterium]|nr:Gfo/Idh/MocA family oxidoreductase [Calditrichota bacterium]